MIKMKWFGHSFWKISNDDVEIVIDPFTDIGYKLPENLKCDIAISSHDHFDHNNVALIKSEHVLLNTPGKFNEHGIDFELIHVWHDENKGADRGSNLLIKFTIEGKTILHCGDLGHYPDDKIFDQLGRIDILLIPVGGIYTINAETAKRITERLEPQIIFPMHYKTRVLNFELDDLENYTKFFDGVINNDNDEILLTDGFFAKSKPVIIIMKYE